ncbi:MAG: hypothetical protein AB3N20_02715 [Rhizobiaceae bacterium]
MTPSHRFAIGQLVCLKNSILPVKGSDKTYRVTGTMPAMNGSLQYRIRCDAERHERVTTEDLLVESPSRKASAGFFRD